MSVKSIIDKGEAFFSERRFDEARDCFLAAIAEDSSSSEAYNDLAVVAIAQQDYRVAIEQLTNCLRIDPYNKSALLNFYDVAMAIDHPQSMGKVVRNFLLKHPDDQEVKQILEAIASLPTTSTRIAVVCLPGLESFLTDIVVHLGENHEVRTCFSTSGEELTEAIKWADTVWIEWANELAVKLTNELPLLEDRRTICRLHSYEAFAGYASAINWDRVDDLIFVAEHIKDQVLDQAPQVGRLTRTHVVPNGINLERFPLTERTRGKNLAFVGDINYKKGPMLLLHAFSELVRQDPEYRLAIAGRIQDQRYVLYFDQMLKEMGLQGHVKLDGWVKDVASWLEDKQYIVSTSLLEGHPVGLMEAMARGLKPVIHNFVGARQIYDDGFIWNSIPEFVQMILAKDYDSGSYRQFIKERFSLEKQLEHIDNILAIEASPVVTRSVEKLILKDRPSVGAEKAASTKETINFYQPLRKQIELTTNRKAFTVDFCRGKRVLHVGCVDAGIMDQRISEGNFLHYQIDQVAAATIGVDLDAEGIARLRQENYEVYTLDLERDCERLKQLSSRVDVIVIPEVLEHLDNIGLALDNLDNSGFDGDILITTPNAFSYRTSVLLAQNVELVHPDHNCYFSVTTLTTLLEKHRFEVSRMLMYYWPMDDEIGRRMMQILKSCPHYAEGMIAIIRRK